jgi:hypothetical protein
MPMFHDYPMGIPWIPMDSQPPGPTKTDPPLGTLRHRHRTSGQRRLTGLPGHGDAWVAASASEYFSEEWR